MVLITNRDFLPERAIDNEKKSSDPNQLLKDLETINKNLERIFGTEVAAKQKVVFKVLMEDEKGEKKAAKALARLSGKNSVWLMGKQESSWKVLLGIDSISVDGKHQKLTVIGNIDAVLAVTKLRKQVGHSQLIGVLRTAEKEEEALTSSVTQGARSKQKLVEENTLLDDATVSNIEHLLQSRDISARPEASTSLSMSFGGDSSFPQRPYPVMLDQDKTKDVMVERKRLLEDQEMSFNRIVELERLLATQKALLATERVVLEELIAKDEQLEELDRALEVEKKKNVEFAFLKENEYFKGVEDCRLKMLERYPELDLSWMDLEFGSKPMLGTINEVPASQDII